MLRMSSFAAVRPHTSFNGFDGSKTASLKAHWLLQEDVAACKKG